MANYVKLTWYNDCDLGRIYYQTGFKNTAIFETEIIAPDYLNEEEGFNNGSGVFIKTSQLLKKNYKFQIIAPQYVSDALEFMCLHDHILLSIIKDTDTIYQSEINNASVTVTWEDTFTDCFALIEVSFQQDDQVFKNNCCNNLT